MKSSVTVDPKELILPEGGAHLPWCQPWWTFMHTAASYYEREPTETDKHEMAQLVEFWIRRMPCRDECLPHAWHHFQTHPPEYTNRQTVQEWVVNLQNTVNQRLGKRVWPVADALVQQKRIASLNLGRVADLVYSQPSRVDPVVAQREEEESPLLKLVRALLGRPCPCFPAA